MGREERHTCRHHLGIASAAVSADAYLLAAGALGVSRRRFLISFSLARTFRYSLVAWLAALYGRAVARAFRHYLAGWSTTIMWIYLGLVVVGILYGLWKFRSQRRQTAAPQEAALSAK